jgi:transposase
MTKAPIEVITSIQRRRRWSQAEKERIVAAAMEPNAVASAVARAAGIHVSQLFRWRKEICGSRGSSPEFMPVHVAPAQGAGSERASVGTIEIELAGGTRLRITGPVDAGTLSATLAALAHGERRR